ESRYPTVSVEPAPEKVEKENLNIRGKVSEDVKKITTEPRYTGITIDKGKGTFKIPAKLKQGMNLITINFENTFGNSVTEIIQVYYKKAEVPLVVDPIIEESKNDMLTITGKVGSTVQKIVIKPGDILAHIDRKNKTFEAILYLSFGKNKIEITAYGPNSILGQHHQQVMYKADNLFSKWWMRSKKKNLSQQLQAKIEHYDEIMAEVVVLREKVDFLKSEVDRLKNQPKIQYRTVNRGKIDNTVAIPKGVALYLVPYNIKSGDNLYSVSRKYLGDPKQYTEIVKYNDDTASEIIQSRKKLLVPTKALLKDIRGSKNKILTRTVVDIAAETYNTVGSGKKL
ncbi:MAG: hypothetical protein KAS39_06355, partial [Actinomycetia bacterium]|nr:hypothetical protein [Actinomycetes bacterium]